MEAAPTLVPDNAGDSDISFAGESSDESCSFAADSSCDDLAESLENRSRYSFTLPCVLVNNMENESDSQLSTTNLNLCNVPEVECSRFCKSKCNQKVQSWSKERVYEIKELFSGNNQSRKNKMLDQLAFQYKAGLPISGFYFHGLLLCNNYFSHVSNVSKHQIRMVINDFTHGKKIYVHGNFKRKRIYKARVNFIAWMKLISKKYGQDGPTDIVTVLPHYMNKSVLYKMYLDEAPKPHLKRASFYCLFKKEFGPRRENKDLPWIRKASFLYYCQLKFKIHFCPLI